MTVLDVLILIVFVGAVAVGFWRGVIVQVGAVAALFVAVVVCRLFGERLACVMATGGEAPGMLDIVLAKAILFILTYIGVRLLALLLKKTTHALQLGALDRFGGVVYTVFEWMLILSLLINLWLVIKPTQNLTEICTLGGGHVAEFITGFAPAVLGWAFS